MSASLVLGQNNRFYVASKIQHILSCVETPHAVNDGGTLIGPWNLSPSGAVGCDCHAMMASHKR